MRVVALPVARRETFEVARDVLGAMRRHRLGTHASAVAFRVLVSLIPAALFGIALLGVLGLESVWWDTVSPTLHRNLQGPVAHALDDVTSRIFERNGVGLIAFGAALVLWNTARAMREIEHALDEIHEQEGRRPVGPAFVIGAALACGVDVCVVFAALAIILPPHLVGGAAKGVLEALRWPAGAILLWVAVTLVFRYAPGQRPDLRWASAGSAAVVLGWLAASALFGVWSAHVANYKTAVGTLTAFLVLTTYVLVLAYVLILGAQLDETLRRREHGQG